MTKDETQVSNIFIILNHIFCFHVQKKTNRLNHLKPKRLRLIESTQKNHKLSKCIYSLSDYWLNNNDWGSYNEGFGTQCVVR
jgi:hypothetical protein